MAPRAYWKGYLKLSLVSCPIAPYPATSEPEKISFHQLNKGTGNRIRYRKVDSETGDEVDQSNIVKGYEVSKDHYIELTSDELEAVAIESKRTIEIDQFVPRDQIDEIYIRDPYYIALDGRMAPLSFSARSDSENRSWRFTHASDDGKWTLSRNALSNRRRDGARPIPVV